MIFTGNLPFDLISFAEIICDFGKQALQIFTTKIVPLGNNLLSYFAVGGMAIFVSWVLFKYVVS